MAWKALGFQDQKYVNASFKMAIKEWKPESCPFRLCRTYLQNIGYL